MAAKGGFRPSQQDVTPGDLVAAVLEPERAICRAVLSSREASKPHGVSQPAIRGALAAIPAWSVSGADRLGTGAGGRPGAGGGLLLRLSVKRKGLLSNFAPDRLARLE